MLMTDPNGLFMKDYESSFVDRTFISIRKSLVAFDCLKSLEGVVRLVAYKFDSSGLLVERVVHSLDRCPESYGLAANFQQIFIVGGLVNQECSKQVLSVKLEKFGTLEEWTDPSGNQVDLMFERVSPAVKATDTHLVVAGGLSNQSNWVSFVEVFSLKEAKRTHLVNMHCASLGGELSILPTT